MLISVDLYAIIVKLTILIFSRYLRRPTLGFYHTHDLRLWPAAVCIDLEVIHTRVVIVLQKNVVSNCGLNEELNCLNVDSESDYIGLRQTLP